MDPLVLLEAVRLGLVTWTQIQAMRQAGLFTPEQWQALDDEYQRRSALADQQAQPGATPGATPTRDGSSGLQDRIDA